MSRLAERVDCRPHERLGNAVLRQVTAERGGLAGDLRRGLLREVGVEVADQNARAVLGQQLGGRTADAAGRARSRSQPSLPALPYLLLFVYVVRLIKPT